eukprot:TRINITY_DN61148_c0_g1_i1.p1 TRINITY_DN61148_c0_g1~~TRINITY_DN61148_c0_g1_i1.p1  ORF type:complete len:784 (-),score=29.89 TRINITY_DN61148_c0_g1_i1:1940-4291(-)
MEGLSRFRTGYHQAGSSDMTLKGDHGRFWYVGSGSPRASSPPLRGVASPSVRSPASSDGQLGISPKTNSPRSTLSPHSLASPQHPQFALIPPPGAMHSSVTSPQSMTSQHHPTVLHTVYPNSPVSPQRERPPSPVHTTGSSNTGATKRHKPPTAYDLGLSPSPPDHHLTRVNPTRKKGRPKKNITHPTTTSPRVRRPSLSQQQLRARRSAHSPSPAASTSDRYAYSYTTTTSTPPPATLIPTPAGPVPIILPNRSPPHSPRYQPPSPLLPSPHSSLGEHIHAGSPHSSSSSPKRERDGRSSPHRQLQPKEIGPIVTTTGTVDAVMQVSTTQHTQLPPAPDDAAVAATVARLSPPKQRRTPSPPSGAKRKSPTSAFGEIARRPGSLPPSPPRGRGKSPTKARSTSKSRSPSPNQLRSHSRSPQRSPSPTTRQQSVELGEQLPLPLGMMTSTPAGQPPGGTVGKSEAPVRHGSSRTSPPKSASGHGVATSGPGGVGGGPTATTVGNPYAPLLPLPQGVTQAAAIAPLPILSPGAIPIGGFGTTQDLATGKPGVLGFVPPTSPPRQAPSTVNPTNQPTDTNNALASLTSYLNTLPPAPNAIGVGTAAMHTPHSPLRTHHSSSPLHSPTTSPLKTRPLSSNLPPAPGGQQAVTTEAFNSNSRLALPQQDRFSRLPASPSTTQFPNTIPPPAVGLGHSYGGYGQGRGLSPSRQASPQRMTGQPFGQQFGPSIHPSVQFHHHFPQQSSLGGQNPYLTTSTVVATNQGVNQISPPRHASPPARAHPSRAP